jgi:uncharacterized protein (TIGR03083 family)
VPTHVARDEIIPVLLAEFDALIELCEPLTEVEWLTPTALPGWTVKDVMSHCYGTEAMLLGESAPEVDIDGLEHVKNPTGQFNEKWVHDLRARTGAEILELFRQATDRRRQELEGYGQEKMDEPSWTPAGADETYGRFMRIRHMDLYVHELDIRDTLGIEDRPAADHLAVALKEPEAALGYVVGKKAGVPDGSAVRLSVIGPVQKTWDVVVDGKARVVQGYDGEPAASLTMPAPLYLRVAAGRVDPDNHLGSAIQMEGDEELAIRLARNLAYMI